MADKRPRRLRLRPLWGADKRPRFVSELSDEQLRFVGLILVVLVAVSMLYCLGFASLAIRDNWQQAPLPWNGTVPVEEMLNGILTVMPDAIGTPTSVGK